MDEIIGKDLDKVIQAGKTDNRYILRLYVTGTTVRSAKAIANLKEICEEHLKGRYELEVIDLYQQPVLAAGEKILAAPTLIKKLPAPIRKLVGDMSNTERVLLGLDLKPVKERGDPNRRTEPERK